MKRIIIDAPDNYSDILTFTLVGGAGTATLNTFTHCAALERGRHFAVEPIYEGSGTIIAHQLTDEE